MIQSLNQSIIDDGGLDVEQKETRLFLVGILNGAINFVLGQIYILIVDWVVVWENHQYSLKLII